MFTASTLSRCRKIVAIGKNYADHIKEMGQPAPKDPVLFLKPSTSLVREPNPILLKKSLGEIHHEIELALIIGQYGKDIPKEKAMDYVGGYALSIDLTARTLQGDAKKLGMPWSLSKGFDYSCPISDVIPKDAIKNPDDIDIWLKVNDEMRQKTNTKNMIHDCSTLIAYISKYFTLEYGDIILTGTPSGVGPIKDGDIVTSGMGTVVKEMKFEVKEIEG